MAIPRSRRLSAGRSAWRIGPQGIAAVTMLVCALFMFAGPSPPIVIWDESRLAVNAIEMHMRGLSLVTTYGFVPDSWNTKPPLVIWLMDVAIALFGPTEFAIRLPAMIASLATLAMVFAFTRRTTHALWPAVVASLLLASSTGFYGEHGARTGDYDAPLCLFTVGYQILFYRAVHLRRAGWPLLLGAAALVAAALMTKSIAGLLPGLGVGLYLLVNGRMGRVLGNPRYYAALMLALLPIAIFYGAREQAAPGYLHAVWANEFAGRYGQALGEHSGPPWYYARLLLLGAFSSAGLFALIAPIGLIRAQGQARAALIFALCCIAGQLAAISGSATKLAHYVTPALPWVAIAVAIGLHALWPSLRRTARPVRAAALLLGLCVAGTITVQSATIRFSLLPERQYYPQAGYGALLAALHEAGVRRVLVIAPGVSVEGLVHYSPQLDFYSRVWSARGMMVSRAIALPDIANGTLASCNPGVAHRLIARGGTAMGFPGCAALIARTER